MNTSMTGVIDRGNGSGGATSVARGTLATPLDLVFLTLAGGILTYVWRFQDLYPILASLKFPILTSLAAVGFFIVDKDRRRSIRGVKDDPIIRINAAILIISVLSIVTSVHDGLSFGFVMNDQSKNFLLMVLIAASIRSFRDVERFALVVLIGGIFYAYYVYTKVAVGMSGRLGDLVYYDANDLGMLLVCSVPIAIYFLLRGRSTALRVIAVLSLPLFLLVIIKTGSRGAFVGLIAMAMYMLFRFGSIPKKARIIAVVGGFVALMAVGSDQYWEMMGTLLNPKDDYNWSGESDTGRMEVWKRGVGYMFSRPILGVGVAAFPVAEGTLSPIASRQAVGVGVKWGAAHNSFVQIGAELGIMGLVLFCMLLWRTYERARSVVGVRAPGARGPPDELVLGQALAGSLIGYMVCGFFLSQAYAAFAFTLYGIVVGMVKVSGPASAAAAASAQNAPARPRSPWRPGVVMRSWR